METGLRKRVYVVCPNCGWSGNRVVLEKACPSCKHFYPLEAERPAPVEESVVQSPELMVKLKVSGIGNRYLAITLYLPGKKTLAAAAVENKEWNDAEKMPHERLAMSAFARFLDGSGAVEKPFDAVVQRFPPVDIASSPDGSFLIGCRGQYHQIPIDRRLPVTFDVWRNSGIKLLEEDEVEDLIEPTGDQLEQAKFLSRFKGLNLPPGVFRSQKHLFAWIREHLGQREYDMANEMEKDFGKTFNRDDPMSVIGALKYWDKAQTSDQIQRAVKLLRRGVDVRELAYAYNFKPGVVAEAEEIVSGRNPTEEMVRHCVGMLLEGSLPETILDDYPNYSEEAIKRAARVVADEYPDAEILAYL